MFFHLSSKLTFLLLVNSHLQQEKCWRSIHLRVMTSKGDDWPSSATNDSIIPRTTQNSQKASALLRIGAKTLCYDGACIRWRQVLYIKSTYRHFWEKLPKWHRKQCQERRKKGNAVAKANGKELGRYLQFWRRQCISDTIRGTNPTDAIFSTSAINIKKNKANAHQHHKSNRNQHLKHRQHRGHIKDNRERRRSRPKYTRSRKKCRQNHLVRCQTLKAQNQKAS